MLSVHAIFHHCLYLSQTDLSAMGPEKEVRICRTKARYVWTSKTCSDERFWSSNR